MVESLCYQLRKEKWLTSTVVLKIRYANFDTETKQAKVSYTSLDSTLNRVALELLERLYTRRIRLRLVGLKFTGIVHGTYQMNLFEDYEEMISFYQSMDKIKNRFGKNVVGASGFQFDNLNS